jgi:hypothetical protein
MNKFLTEDELKGRHSEEKQQLHREIQEKDASLREYRKEHGKLEVFFNRVIDCIEPISPLDSVFEKMYRSKKGHKQTEIIPVMHNTDAHMGAVQEPDEIEHFGQFNPALCDKRVLGFAGGYVDWCQLHRGPYNIKKCHVLFTGDLISGDIHEELRITNEFPVTEQVVRAAQLYAKEIALLAPYFEEVTCEFVTEDNHSRLTKKPQAKEAGINSYGYLIAKMLEAYIAKLDNVQFNIHAMHEKVVRVSTRNYLLTHMHGVKAWMGIPWYGIERRAAREATARQSIIMSDISRANEIGFHKIIHGHFHTPFDTPLYSGGGSVSGTDAYDHGCGRHSAPSQSAWMVHPKWGEFNRINFWLERYDNDENS